MTLALLVAAKNTGTFGTFEVIDGNVSKNKVPLLVFFNDTTALVPMTARSQFTTPDEHSAFDGALMGLPAVGVSVQYIESVAKFMDPVARFKEFLAGTLAPESVGLKLTHAELAVPAAFTSAKAKFVELFTAPTPPRELDPRPLGAGEKLVITTRADKPYQVGNGSYTMSYKQAESLWNNKLQEAWLARRFEGSRTTALTRTAVDASGYSRDAVIFRDRVEIGCQTIQRNQIEELAQRMGWKMI